MLFLKHNWLRLIVHTAEIRSIDTLIELIEPSLTLMTTLLKQPVILTLKEEV